MFARDLEVKYAQEFEESLPANWVSQLENVDLKVVKKMGGDEEIHITRKKAAPEPSASIKPDGPSGSAPDCKTARVLQIPASVQRARMMI